MDTQSTSLQNNGKKYPVKQFFEHPDIQKKFKEILGNKAQQFIASVLQLANSNTMLANADPVSVSNAAMTAAILDLPINNNLGFAYIIGYNEKQKDGTFRQVAQFQLGYKGFIQLAQRSGQFLTISSCPVYEGQIKENNPLTGMQFDWTAKKSDIIMGYAAYFKLLNGFEKTLYMPIENIKAHGKKYSQTFKKGYGLWDTDFDAMAQKTVIKLLLSKFAPLSVEMQRAVISDQAVIKDYEEQEVQYVDNEVPTIDKEKERIYLLIQDATTVEQLSKLESNIPDDLLDFYMVRMDDLKALKNGK